MLNITLDIKPLSINKAWRSGPRYRTKDYIQYEKDILRILPRGQRIKGEFEIDLTLYLKNYSRSDVDNFSKCLIDVLVKSGIIEDDRKCVRLQIIKYKSPRDYLELQIIQYES